MSWLTKRTILFTQPRNDVAKLKTRTRPTLAKIHAPGQDNAARRWEVFVSYASENRETALAMANDLQRRGLRVWFDQFEIDSGEPFADRILEGLDQSDNAAVSL